MINSGYLLAAILVCSLVTFLLRWAPFALFGGGHGMPPFLRRLADRLPAAIIAVLVVFCLKDLPAAGETRTIITLLSVASVVLLHLWRHNTLLSIAGGTLLYMLLLRHPF